MKSFLLILCVAALSACSSSQRAYDGDGNPVVVIACINNQLIAGMTTCLKEAEKMCPSGYTWSGSTSHPVPWQITEPEVPRYAPNPALPAFAPGIVRYSNNHYGGYTKKPRVVNLMGQYQYITVKCK